MRKPNVDGGDARVMKPRAARPTIGTAHPRRGPPPAPARFRSTRRLVVMLAIVYVSAFVVAAWAPFAYHHRAVHGVVNPTHLALTLFNAINLLICLWENALYLHVKKIRKKYLAMKRTLGHGTFPPKLCLFEDVSLRDALTYEHWGIVWATYSLLDPSYSDQVRSIHWSPYDRVGVVNADP